jgi:hypothetical protein
VRTTAMGAFIVTGEDSNSKEVDAGEYCFFPTYLNLWKHDFLYHKVSRPVEDICKDCYAFANCHMYLANHTLGCNDDDGNGNSNNNGNRECSSDGCSYEGSNNDGSNNFFMLESAQWEMQTLTIRRRHQQRWKRRGS